MIELFVVSFLVCGAVVIEVLFPGHPIYHAGWFNVVLLAVTAGVALSVRRVAGAVGHRIVALTLCAIGTAIIALAGVAFGLLAPDDATVIAAPDATVRVADLGGSLHFDSDGTVSLVRGASSTVIPPTGSRVVGSFVLRSFLRNDVAIDATDLRGAHLTITQPNGSVFLSPVLSMQQRQTISGVALPFDTFAVPAEHRLVHVMLFDPHQAVALLPAFNAGGGSAVLFAVDNDTDHPLQGGIGVARDGIAISVAGLRLRPVITPYPAVTYSAIPLPAVALLGLLLVLVGACWPKIAEALDARRNNT